MVTMAQRIEELRTKKGISRPALAAALGLPRLSVEKFETGRQTPTQEQQQKLAAAFGVSLSYLRGETDDPTSMDNWLSGALPQEEPVSIPKAVRRATAAVVAQSGDNGKNDGGAVFVAHGERVRVIAIVYDGKGDGAARRLVGDGQLVVLADRRRPDEDSGRVGLGDDENEDGPGAVGAAGIVELLAHGRAALVELAHSRDGLFEDAADVVA